MPFDSREFEYADTQVKLLGVNLTGLRGLVYKTKHDKAPVTGQGRYAKAIQRGEKLYDGTLMLLKSDYDALDKAAVAAGYDDITDVPGHLILITCCYQKENSTMLSVDTLIGVDFTEVEDGLKSGDKFKEVSLPFLFLRKKKIS